MLNKFIRKFSSFTYLNVTQFLGALNDNIYKLLIVYFFIQIDGIENSHTILATTGITFVLPFLLFSSFSGTLADRFSKRNIIVFTKIFELVIMLIGLVAFIFESRLGSYFVLFLLATQSAIFGPSKYGILPEIVASEKISSANGLMTSFTFLAIIFGTFFASFILDISGKSFLFASIFCISVALIGMITSFCIEYTLPAGSKKKFNIDILYEIFTTLKIAKKQPSLLTAIVGSAFFLFLAAFFQLNMIPFAVQSLQLTDVQGGYLFLITALGIGVGAVVAGKICGKSVELGLIPVSGIVIIICCFFLDAMSHSLFAVVPLVFLLGLFGGMFEIPLDSYIQIASPQKYRGQIVAATNFLSFFGVLLASVLVYLLTEVFNLQADKGFTIIGSLTLIMTSVLSYYFFDYFTRFICTILSFLHFRISYEGKENIPEKPAIYVCNHTDWNDTLIMLGAQRRRLRFFIEQEQSHSKVMKRLYRLLRVYLIHGIQPLEKNKLCLTVIKNNLKKGISVCIFVNNEDIATEIEKLKHSYSFREILDETTYPIVPVIIEKGEKNKKPRFFKRMMEKFRVPAYVSFGLMIKGNHKLEENEAEFSEFSFEEVFQY
ncbi:MAG: MFS transporter [Chlamydia sp. 32-24]|nr:MAG: MFS transporter [Chlamydia sp. 32-24]